MMALTIWCLASLLAGLLAGWTIGRYGHSDDVEEPLMNEGDRKYLAAALARTNNKEFRQ
jgi:hypothetical protein